MRKRLIRRLYSFPLRTHLLAMAFLLALPAIMLIIQSGINQRNEAMRKGFVSARRLTNAIAREQHNLTSNVEQLLAALEQVPEIQKHDTTVTNAILAAILKKNPQYINIIIADRLGDIWASGLPMKSTFSIKNRFSFQQAVKTKRFSSGDFAIGKLSGEPSIGFSYPIIDAKGNLQGVIAASFDLERFKDLLPINGLPEGSSFNIIDRNGIIVVRNLNPEKYVGTKLSDDKFLRMKNGPDRATFMAGDLTDDQRIVSYYKERLQGESSPYLYIRTAFPLQEVVASARKALLINIAILSSFLLIAVLTVIFLGNIFFVKRIKRLQLAAQQLAEGDLQVRASNDGEGGEIGRLAEVFDDMAQKLSIRQATLIKSEHDLYELNQELTSRVDEEAERRITHERLLARHARLVAMGEMIGAIAHQWRQPLATLGATIQSIRMAGEHKCLDDAFLQKAEEDAQKQLYYMSETIEDFRNFFTPEKIAEKFDVRDKVEEVITLVSPQFVNSGVSLLTIDNTKGRDLQIEGYQNEFKQSLLNLVSNAFDAIIDKADQGGIAPVASEVKGTVTIVTDATKDALVIEVSDNGCGIPPEYADMVFDPYFTTKSGSKGTGIGLYMTKLIIEESMEGRLSFTSSAAGTRFRIELARKDTGEEVVNG
ncbi:MAG: ATP-binding protein [Desulfuromonadaceae bacterium]|nr:ATP-binding protein [Desulfuromonadaceae bacterium]MDD5106915.1 ATP-binding protein [Desulfuromonadaceae bacterium]